MKLAIVGTGYVGLVSGVCLSDFGHDVTCIDSSKDKIEMLRSGKAPIYEPGLEDVMARNVAAGRLTFSTDLAASIQDADAVFIAVGTPSRRGDGHADLTYVMEAAKEIAKALNKYKVIITKSTVPVGTNRDVYNTIHATNPDADFDVASNPEFLREGAAIEDFMRPDRVIVGVENDRAKEVLSEIYRPLFLRDFPIVFTDLESAEVIKYAANAFLATKISFINEVAALCEKVGADIKSVSKGMGYDGRIGNKFLHAGPGYGGSCFPKDTAAFALTAREADTALNIVEAAIASNEATKLRMIEKIQSLYDGSLKGAKIAFCGVTFKPNTDDMREAPSLTLIPALQTKGAEIRVTDPQGRSEGEALLPGVSWHDDAYGAAQGADLIVMLTEWNEFRALNLKKLAKIMAVPRMADLRNIYHRQDVLEADFIKYIGVGR